MYISVIFVTYFWDRLSASPASFQASLQGAISCKAILHVMKSNLELAPSAVSSMEADHCAVYQGEAVGSSNAFLSVPFSASQAVNRKPAFFFLQNFKQCQASIPFDQWSGTDKVPPGLLETGSPEAAWEAREANSLWDRGGWGEKWNRPADGKVIKKKEKSLW